VDAPPRGLLPESGVPGERCQFGSIEEKSHFISGPAAEYMSKVGQKEEKNELCGGGASRRPDGHSPVTTRG
jgi:hypothetical protein